MKKLWAGLLGFVQGWRSRLWASFTGSDEATWGSHWVLVIGGSLIPAVIAGAIWGLAVGTVVGFAFSEAWLLFMSGREVSDFVLHHLRADKLGYIRDGIGDLAGPVVNHALWWIGLLGLIVWG